MEKVSDEGLVRGIRLWDLIGVVINSIIGAGIFVLPAKAFGVIGSYSLLAFVACAFVAVLIVLCFVEVGSRFSDTGGPYRYARTAFGPAIGFQVGWMNWLARLSAYATNCNLLVVYLSFFLPVAGTPYVRALVITLLTVILTTINYIGVRDATLTSNFFSIAKLLPLFIFIGVGLFYLTPANFALGEAPQLGAFSGTVLLIVYAFTGFENASVPAGEIENPRRNLPIAILVAMGLVTAIYLLIQVVCIGTLPTLGQTERPLADAANNFLGPLGAALIAAGAITSIIGNLNVNLLTSPRIPFAMSLQRELPAKLSATHQRFHTPHIAIVLTGGLVLALTISSTLIQALTLSTIARLLAYIATCAALPQLRYQKDAPPARFIMPAGIVISIVAILLSIWLLANKLDEALNAAIALVVGIVIYVLYRMKQRD